MDIQSIALSAGGPFLAGLAVGYAVKKLIKLALFLLGVYILLMYYLNSQGIVKLNFNPSAIAEELSMKLDLLVERASQNIIPVSSFLLGFIVGFKL
ncbi:MAG: hypothetical protein DSO07_09530 [Thermoproteota archaeon]|jgi:uncharacterized membrane protein (Fun14 family)|uniref:FUN14 family protein n=1 Tax=Candidatus Methanodesulfokora washburnensis TaxID=2478471 RepID=A0A3R9QZZ8_9CREN|nr:FUN14 domain-containing protein [Candidatus Methanodesulfokores washburnensis]RSN77698.1 hypothetical protein D6D85_02440 [Candidatus Methanodesulfokores washburnensis]RZN62782.1 MAG: hypothetical protein EF810_01985 [Candidatus Methanodesulfokores washburnensis]TDA40320.1 MAG: hypothetical protein DSO07_09530 [Candidatus Korarchaeota archaeon]